MDILFELLRYFVILVVGVVLIKWYERRKGWEYHFQTSLVFVLLWKTLMLFLLIGVNFLLDFNPSDLSLNLFLLYPISLVVVSFFVNILLGLTIFKVIYNQKAQESFVIILIIVIIELILESFLLYSTLIPETIVSTFNL